MLIDRLAYEGALSEAGRRNSDAARGDEAEGRRVLRQVPAEGCQVPARDPWRDERWTAEPAGGGGAADAVRARR